LPQLKAARAASSELIGFARDMKCSPPARLQLLPCHEPRCDAFPERPQMQ
jgi:phage terminase small subunit